MNVTLLDNCSPCEIPKVAIGMAFEKKLLVYEKQRLEKERWGSVLYQ